MTTDRIAVDRTPAVFAAPAGLQRLEHRACFGGWQDVYQHDSTATGTSMRFAVYLPPQAAQGCCPVLYWLSGLTCTEQNFITKAGAQRYAAEHGLIVVAPDTSPRGEGVADADRHDLGQGAGFYVDATQAPWAPHFRMQTYIAQELPSLIESLFPANDHRSISGHSMGGHGALVTALRHPGRYRSVSAFAPICSPTQVAWGRLVLGAYLGDDPEVWKAWDACELVARTTERLPLLVEQGAADDSIERNLRPELLKAACDAAGHPLDLRLRAGYDHSYYFVASFIGEHMAYHAMALRS